jgi:hypothetical protein
MRPTDLISLLRDGTLDPRTTALLWLLLEGGVPLVVAGTTSTEARAGVAGVLLSLDPSREWVLVDGDAEPMTTDRLAALLRGGVALGITIRAADLEAVLDRFSGMGLPEDAIRRLGAVVLLGETEAGLRCRSVHYLRPAERDAQRHVQRRPPAVLTAWDGAVDAYEDYAWGITPELADRVDRAQADLEERQADRARFLASLPFDGVRGTLAEQVRAFLAAEPERVPAPAHETATPSPFSGGLLDVDGHTH